MKRIEIQMAGCSFFSLLILLSPVPAWAECPTIDFENLAIGTVVTGQYPGVMFSAPDRIGSCDGHAYIRDMTALGGTSSPVRALTTRPAPGCEFSPEHLRMVFDRALGRVSFTVGPYCGTYRVEAYAAPAGGAPISVQTFGITDCMTLHGVHRVVNVISQNNDIRRIEIDAGDGAAETIDDLLFNFDVTPPVVEIHEPERRSCVCDPVDVEGVAVDPDGVYVGDIIEYRAEDVAGWTFAGFHIGPRTGTLYTANTGALPGGWYLVRVTGLNSCGLSNSDTTFVYLDKAPPAIDWRSPPGDTVIGGVVCFDGSVHESVGTRGGCLESYTVNYSSGGSAHPVNPAQPVYDTPVHNDPFAHWNTRAGIADGLYVVQVAAVDVCGQENAEARRFLVDNTAPIAHIAEPLECSHVEGRVPVIGTANDAHLVGWTLQFTGDGHHDWVTIASGNRPVVDGVLGTWDTRELPACAYTLRLRVWDAALVDCNGAIQNVSEYTVSVSIGDCAPFDADGDGDVDLEDFSGFDEAFTGPTP